MQLNPYINTPYRIAIILSNGKEIKIPEGLMNYFWKNNFDLSSFDAYVNSFRGSSPMYGGWTLGLETLLPKIEELLKKEKNLTLKNKWDISR